MQKLFSKWDFKLSNIATKKNFHFVRIGGANLLSPFSIEVKAQLKSNV